MVGMPIGVYYMGVLVFTTWQNANIIQLSVCGGDMALCQITVTTCSSMSLLL